MTEDRNITLREIDEIGDALRFVRFYSRFGSGAASLCLHQEGQRSSGPEPIRDPFTE